MKHKANNTNRAVMYGVMGMAVVVMMVVLMFLGWMAPQKGEEEEEGVETEITTGGMADSLQSTPEALPEGL